MLGKQAAIKAVDTEGLVSSPCVQAGLEKGTIVGLEDSNNTLRVEQMKKVDVVFSSFGVDPGTENKTVITSEVEDPSPLNVWLLLFCFVCVCALCLLFIPVHLFFFVFCFQRREGSKRLIPLFPSQQRETRPKRASTTEGQNTNTQTHTRFFSISLHTHTTSVFSAQNGSSSTQHSSTPKKSPKPSQLPSTTITTASNPPQQQRQPQNQSSPGLYTTHLPLTTTTPHLGSYRVLLTNVSSPRMLVRRSLTVLILLPSRLLLLLRPRFNRSIS
ncbi:hypothetical protein K457DRAFT_602618 [Linnemannia elongata AG-77]|uniref:Uncharacterized protein n=1 Tax=Linnemannia elongata AG-77 TaxID=1314771 RepID=A0A197JRU9_9FUNG|nr:hypothetical protein K457DRAFT_602618 [Linnemannia elongata AG-77]